MKLVQFLSIPALLLSCTIQAQTAIFLLDRQGNPGTLSDVDQRFILSRFEKLDLASCRQELLTSQPRLDYRRLEVPFDQLILKMHISPDVMSSNELVLYTDTPDGPLEYLDCETAQLLPVLALMVTADFEGATRTSLLRQQVLAHNTGLTSYEPNRLMARSDTEGDSSTYMDFRLSSKHPILPNAATLNATYDSITETLEHIIPGDDEYFLQLFLGFSGRFSHYIGTRESAPVISRRFNPELFWRFWSSEDNYVDIGMGHESNGQRIDTQASLIREGDAFEANNESRDFARDSLSRGWDYPLLNWRQAWNDNLITQLKIRHFMSNGPLQGKQEEYNLWEDGGTVLKPLRQFAGITLDLQYNFSKSRCLLGSSPICFDKLKVTQETGYSAMFKNNSTTVELTSDFFGLPIQVWSRTGYNSSLVDYFKHSNSWGLGIELISR